MARLYKYLNTITILFTLVDNALEIAMDNANSLSRDEQSLSLPNSRIRRHESLGIKYASGDIVIRESKAQE